MQDPIKFKIGEIELHLRLDKRALFRLSDAGIQSIDPSKSMAQTFTLLACCNENPATKHLTGEDLFAESPDFETPEEGRAWGESLTTAISKMSKRAESPGKKKARASKSGRSRESSSV